MVIIEGGSMNSGGSRVSFSVTFHSENKWWQPRSILEKTSCKPDCPPGALVTAVSWLSGSGTGPKTLHSDADMILTCGPHFLKCLERNSGVQVEAGLHEDPFQSPVLWNLSAKTIYNLAVIDRWQWNTCKEIYWCFIANACTTKFKRHKESTL